MTTREVDILGAMYTVVTDATEKDFPHLRDADGYCDFYGKVIVVKEWSDRWENEGDTPAKRNYLDKVLRHEIVHAMIHESGMSDMARDERVVEWVAIQSGKLFRLFDEMEVLDNV